MAKPIVYLILLIISITLMIVIAQGLRAYYFKPVNDFVVSAQTRNQRLYREVALYGPAEDFKGDVESLSPSALSWSFGIFTAFGVVAFIVWLSTFYQERPFRVFFLTLFLANILLWSILIPEASIEILFGQINSTIINFFKV